MIDWTSFKNNLESYFSSYIAKDYNQAAIYIATLYDNAMRGGGDTLYQNFVLNGNKAGLENIIKSSLHMGGLTKTGTFNSLELISTGLSIYWAGSSLTPFNPPPGTVGILQNTVLNPGTAKGIPTYNSNDFNTWINAFINMAKLHLNTLSGSMLALVPSPTGPIPTLFPWQGYR